MFAKSAEADLSYLSPGDQVYIRGTVQGKMMNVLLKDSEILGNE